MQYQNTIAGGETLFAIPYGHENALRGQWNYQFAIYHQNANNYVEKQRGGGVGPVPTMYWEYDEGDMRRDATCVNYAFRAAEKDEFLKSYIDINKPSPSGIAKWYFGKFRYEWMNVRVSSDDGVKPMILRYSDVLLMAAECANELNDLNTAKGYLKKVRQRAFGSNTAAVEAYMDGITSKEQMFKAIFAERALEFCGEMLRKQDLIRWGLLGDAMDETVAKLQALRTHTDYTSTITGRTYPFSQIGTGMYFRLTENDTELLMYGLNPGETTAPTGNGWIQWGEYNDAGEVKYDYIKESKISDERIDALMFLDPDTRQYWPIFASMLSTNPMLKNDYGY
ncbi:MAG: RagB/SusD family nutrient uptake outer membrane protein, partial [Alistipes sp.]|nr:RagB/SusD family nutrient uptake outer membrane protein [Alistipes sp.]